MLKLSVRHMCPLILMMASPLPAWALCCPGDIKNHASAASGIGQSQSSETDVSLDPHWTVHTFERDGLSYLQVSDRAGAVQLVIGRVGTYHWVLPAGPIDTRITLPSDGRAFASMMDAREVYRHPDFRLLVSGSGPTASWWVENLSEQL